VVDEIEIALAGGGSLKAVVARPASAGPRPGVIVIHEVFGDQPEIRAVCEEFATRGYVAVMPDLFSTGGPRVVCVARAMAESASGKAGRISGYIEAARAWLAEREDVDGGRIGVIGFCMGGAFALAYVGAGPSGVRVAAVNYADVPRGAERLRRACPIVASYGRRDLILGRRQPELLRRHLEQLGVDHDVKVYDEAGHGFMTQGRHPVGRLVFLPMRYGYAAEPAGDAWQRVFAFFDARLQPAQSSPAELLTN
jgi:carboxymethylenebutenolidase